MNIILLPPDTQQTITLTDPLLINHLHSTLKPAINDRLKVGIKQGNLGHATLAQLSDTHVTLTDIECLTPPPKKLPLTVILAIPRPKVLRRLILDMTAMGVTDLYLVNSYRSEKSYWQSPLLSKIDAFIHEGLQQAGDTIPMIVTLKKRLKPFVEDDLPLIIANKQAIIAHPYATQHFSQVWQPNNATVLVIGAEGGFIPYEVALFNQVGCLPAHIGKRILRTENAVSVLCGYTLVGYHT